MASIKDEKDYEPKMNKAIDKVAATVVSIRDFRLSQRLVGTDHIFT